MVTYIKVFGRFHEVEAVESALFKLKLVVDELVHTSSCPVENA